MSVDVGFLSVNEVPHIGNVFEALSGERIT